MNDFTHFFLFSFFHAFAADKKRKKMAAISQAWAPNFFFYPVPRDGSTASSGFNLPTVRWEGWGRLRGRW